MESLGSTVVIFAWIMGAVAVIGGVLLLIAGMNTRGGGSSVIATGLLVAVQGLVAAVFVALIGRYAQMRAAQAQSST